MRRISVEYAAPTMLISRPLYDHFGRLVLREGSKLSASQVAGLEELGVGELFIQDKRVDDVVLWPLITPELEGSLSCLLKQVLQKLQYIFSAGKAQMLDLSQVEQGVCEMIQQLFPAAMGEPVVVGCHSIKDYEFVHPVKVTSLSLLIGKAAGLEQAELINLGMASLLQNIAYATFPQGIIDKEGMLDNNDINRIKKHPTLGAEIVRRYGSLSKETALIIEQHHERWNGHGYPSGLTAKNICLGARILAMTDSIVALVSRRPYRGYILPKEANEFVNAFSGDLSKAYFLRPHQAMEFIIAYSSELFDPDLVKVFMMQFPTYPSGTMVKLNTGEVGIVSNINPGFSSRPKVRLCYDRELRNLDSPVEINLADADHQRKLITEVMEY